MSDAIIIRPITAADVEGFHAAFDSVAREKEYLAMLQAPPIEKTREFVLNNIRNDIAQMVAADGDKIVGWCDILPGTTDVHRHAGTLGMGIVAAYRGKGFGTRLIQATIDRARERGITRVQLRVREENDRAIALYKKMGFEIEGRCRNANCVEGRYESTYMMAVLF